MPEQEYTVTEHLAQVIDAIQLGRKTGVLTVQRGEGPTFEGGMIIFVSGQPVRAQVGYMNTPESLEWLNSWRECRFAFLPYIPPDLALASPALLPGKSPTTAPITGKHPSIPGTSPITGQHPAYPGAQPGNPVGGSQSYPGAQPTYPGMQPGQPSFVHSAPYRIKQVDEAMYIMDQRGFPRIYRRLLLLLDGSRTILELAQLFGRSPDEVYEFVSHLEAAGLVRH